LHQLQALEPAVEIIWRAFELRPEPIPTLDPNGEYLHRVWGSSVYPLAERLNIKMKLPPVQPRSRGAHEAAHWARHRRRFNDYNEALFRAFFERGEDIGNTDVLARLASEVGLEGNALRQALDKDEYLESVLADEQEAKRLGISGVPAFIADRRVALSGVQSVENLKKLIERARSSV
jgi:predicted DsbA family dithiol-disulfide isomerase